MKKESNVMKKLFHVFILITIANCNVQAQSGWKIIQITTGSDNEVYEESLFIQDGKLKQSSQTVDVIIDFTTRKLTFINHGNHSYWRGSKIEFENEIEEFSKKMMIEAFGEEGYREYQKNMDAMKVEAHGKPMDIEIKEENESEMIGGFNGKKHSVYVNGDLMEELWLCSEINLTDEIDFQIMQEFFKELSSNDEAAYSDSEEYISMLKNGGFPIKEIMWSFGEVINKTELKEAMKQKIPASAFQAPSDYSKGSLMDVMMQQEY